MVLLEQQVLATNSTHHLPMEGITLSHLLVLLVILQQRTPGHMITTVDRKDIILTVVDHPHHPVDS